MSNPTMKRTTDLDDVREYIKECIILKFGTLTAYARKHDVSLAYISGMLSGDRPIPEWMLKQFKIKRTTVTTWERA